MIKEFKIIQESYLQIDKLNGIINDTKALIKKIKPTSNENEAEMKKLRDIVTENKMKIKTLHKDIKAANKSKSKNPEIIKKPMSKKVKSTIIVSLCAIFLLTVLFLTYLPLIAIALISFTGDAYGQTLVNMSFQWYIEIFRDDTVRNAIAFTLEITLISTLLSTVFGTMAAIGINSLSSAKRKKMILLNNVPILNADIVTGVFLLLIFQIISLLINRIILGFFTTLIAHVLFSTPYVILSILPKLSELDDNLYDASVDLGCTPFQAIRKVIIPSIKPGIFAGMLLAFTMSIDDFIITYFVIGAEYNNFSTWLYGSLQVLKGGQWNQACAYSTVLTTLTIVIIVSYQLISKKNKK